MTISRIKQRLVLKSLIVVAVLAYAVAGGPVRAQLVDRSDGILSDREASFLPQTDDAPSVGATPGPATNAISSASAASAASEPPLDLVPPGSAAPARPGVTTSPRISGFTTPEVPPLLPAVGSSSQRPLDLGKPVEAETLEDIHPESVGLLTQANGGLGATMWKGTPRAVLERLLPTLSLPTPSPALNHLAQRFLLTTATVPEGTSGSQETLIAMRIEKLIMLGDAEDAWKLMRITKSDQVNDITKRLAAETALLGDTRDDVCAKLPEIMKTNDSPAWQELLLVCQLRAKDTKGAQLTFALLHTQNVNDETDMALVEKNILSTGTQLPRRLSPLKPLTLALMRLVDVPYPGEIYAHPDAALIPELLLAKAREDNARLALAERAAERGVISPAALAAAYANTAFPPATTTDPARSTETGPRLHAFIYQAAVKEPSAQKRIAFAAQFMAHATPALLNGSGAAIVSDMMGAQAPSEALYVVAPTMVRIYLLAGKPDAALEWLKLAKRGSIGMPAVAADMQTLWPLIVLAGLESDKDYAVNFRKWLNASLSKIDERADDRPRREQVATLLLVLDADGFAVSEESWATVIDGPVMEKHPVPPPLLSQRLRSAGRDNRRGEAVLLSLVLSGADASLADELDMVRALRLTGLTTDAAVLAREVALKAMMSATAKP